MTEKQVEAQLLHEPFQPLEVIKTDGAVLKIPYAHAAVMMRAALLVFIGVKSATSRSAKTFETIPFDHIEKIVQDRPSRRRRKRAS